jgi:hypothetical protein
LLLTTHVELWQRWHISPSGTTGAWDTNKAASQSDERYHQCRQTYNPQPFLFHLLPPVKVFFR